MPKLAPLAVVPLAAIALGKLALHLATNGNYGYFIDELYYIACSRHLAWGYVDQPPMIAAITWGTLHTLGDSLPALRFLPALAGAEAVFLAGAIARELGGGRRAQLLAALALTVAPVLLYLNTVLSMNPFDVLFCGTALWLAVVILRRDEAVAPRWRSPRTWPLPALWVTLGFVLGSALLTKLSALFLVCGLGAGLVLGGRARLLRTPGPWLALGLAALLFAPHVAWQVAHGWPTLEFMHNAAAFKNRALGPLGFLAGQAMEVTPPGLALLLLGVAWLLAGRGARGLRPLGVMYLVVFALFVLRGAKPYYAAPYFPLLLAAGAVGLERLAPAGRRRWLVPGVATVVLACGVVLAPMGLPILPIPRFLRYQAALGGPAPSGENKAVGALPQQYADMFGHHDLVARVARVYHALPAAERARCGIFGGSYALAGAVDFFGPALGLPPAMSGQNSYWLWGPTPGRGDPMIVMGGDAGDLARVFERIEQVDTADHPLAMPWRRHLPIYLCRGFRVPLADAWRMTKNYQ